MCYIFNCFGWTLDLIQRFITFFLACWLAYAVGLGLVVALTAGIAYGYNYSLAEFLTFTRSDVTVYMRRGQFYDRPDIARGFRRTAEDETEVSPNSGIDYQEYKQDSMQDTKPALLGDSWRKAHDTRKYAERLVKYEHKPMRRIEMSDEALQAQEFTEPETIATAISQIELTQPQNRYESFASTMTTLSLKITSIISITPNLLLPTALFQSGSSQIVMRNFKPVEVVETLSTTPSAEEYTDSDNDRLGNMDLVETPDNYEPSHFKNKALLKTLYVQRTEPRETPPLMESKETNEDIYSPTPTTIIPMRRLQDGTLGRPADYPIEEFYLT